MLDLVVGGLGVLVALAVAIGHGLDRQARDSAWARIATSRRILHERQRDLEEREVRLEVREETLGLHERRLEHREHLLFGRESLLEQLEREQRGADRSTADPAG